MFTDITAVLLAGGKSSRMGVNKAFLPWKDSTVIEEILKVLITRFPAVVISTNTPEEFTHLPYSSCTDIISYPSPLSGIHAALTHSQTELNFIVSCDFPLLSGELIDCVVASHGALPVSVCYGSGYLQHLIGMYEKRIVKELGSYLTDLQIQSQDPTTSIAGCRIKKFLEITGYLTIDITKESFYYDDLFLNLNRPEDYKKLLQLK